MRKFLLTLAVVASLVTSYVVIGASSPFGPKLDKELKKLGRSIQLDAVLNVNSTLASGASAGLGVYIPKDAVIVDSFIYTETQIVSASSNQIAFGCDAGEDLLAYSDLSGNADDSIVAGAISRGTETGYNHNDAHCEISYLVASGASGVTAGKVHLFVEYMEPR